MTKTLFYRFLGLLAGITLPVLLASGTSSAAGIDVDYSYAGTDIDIDYSHAGTDIDIDYSDFVGRLIPKSGSEGLPPPEYETRILLDSSDQTERDLLWSFAIDGGGTTPEGRYCEDFMSGGVVRSWYLRERNRADFRLSKTYCRILEIDGMLGDEYERDPHFTYSGSYTSGNSSIPEERLPVGVRTFWRGMAKLTDVELLHAAAPAILDADEYGGLEDGEVLPAGTALYADFDYRWDLTCPDGYVMSGLKVRAMHHAGGRNQAEIRAVKIQCTRLYELLIITH